MPNPPQRRRRSSSSYGYGPGDNDHPFLTPKGYRLQRQGRIGDAPPLPHYAPAPSPFPGEEINGEIVYQDEFGNPIPIDSDFEDPALNHSHTRPRDTKPFVNWRESRGGIVNVRASRKFPDVARLARMPLTPYFETKPVRRPEQSQLRAIGKLFIYTPTNPWGEPASGSAWIAGPSLLMTSAHNLYDVTTRTWARWLEFFPGYDYYSTADRPSCRITSCHIPRGYFDNPTSNHDIAMCYVDRNIGDIVDAVIPSYPIESNTFFDDNEVAIVGYPATSGFDFGKQLWQSKGEYLFSRNSGGDDEYSPVLATDFGGGASGCPWLVRDPRGREQYVAVGATSGHAKVRFEPGEPNLMATMSPIFSKRMFDTLRDDHVVHEFDA